MYDNSNHVSLEDAEAWSVSRWELETENPIYDNSGDLDFFNGRQLLWDGYEKHKPFQI
jgi:hypothetical protein